MPKLKNPKHELFCQSVAKGKNHREAYLDAYGRSSDSSASRLMERSLVSERVDELQNKGARRVCLTLEAAHRFLLEVIEARPADIDEHSPLCQGYRKTATGTEYKLVDKLRALELAMKLQGKLREGAVTDSGPLPEGGIVLTRELMEYIQQKRRAALLGTGPGAPEPDFLATLPPPATYE